VCAEVRGSWRLDDASSTTTSTATAAAEGETALEYVTVCTGTAHDASGTITSVAAAP
jgi:hypothetical protein